MTALRISNYIIGGLMIAIAILLGLRPNVPSVIFIQSITSHVVSYGVIAALFAAIGLFIAIRNPPPVHVIMLLIPLWILLFSQCWFLARNLDRPLWMIGYFAGSSFFILVNYWHLEMINRDSHNPTT